MQSPDTKANADCPVEGLFSAHVAHSPIAVCGARPIESKGAGHPHHDPQPRAATTRARRTTTRGVDEWNAI